MAVVGHIDLHLGWLEGQPHRGAGAVAGVPADVGERLLHDPVQRQVHRRGAAARGRHHLPPGENDSVILSEEAFGHLGNGGSLGFADPRARLSFGYVMNRLGDGVGLDPRGQALVDAVYRTLGYRREARGGMWYS